MREGPEPTSDQPPFGAERDQLAGAFVVDPAGGAPPDRILVMNIFSAAVDTAVAEFGYLEGLTINGLSWPATERMNVSVGDSLRWRVVNASNRAHPMHLHGFYYTVLSHGTQTVDTIYAPADRRLVVTEQMRPRTTMTIEWSPSRPGAWLFHCHLSFHVTPHIRLPGAAAADHGDHEVHMAGLVIGIEVAPGATDLIARGETKSVDLFANEYGDRQGYRYGFAVDPDFVADSVTDVPGPLLTFERYESVDMTVHNRMSFPTGVHWHGLELDAWSDGVPGWSRSEGRMSPAIAPGDAFTYRLSFMRPGTFIYHSHLNDVEQLTGGLYGPLIVLDEGETFDPGTDHVMILGWNTPEAQGLEDIDLNGGTEQPPANAQVGERHRFRVINISPAGAISAWVFRGEEQIPITLLARDGADLPQHQQVPAESLPRVGAGATADFTWTPTEPGTYEVRIGFTPQASHRQTWEVR
jgi:FtsP/CotA-like multicopper oxidase with cupredoxin domain